MYTEKELKSLVDILKNEGLEVSEELEAATKDPQAFEEHVKRYFGKSLYLVLYGDFSKLPLYIHGVPWKKTLARWRMSCG